MKGSEERLIRYMEGSKKRFVIPVYQRNYDWKTEHYKQLYDDLIKVVRQNRRSHFFGSLVSVYNANSRQDEFLIIDGQQRLTTISLLYLAMYNLMQKSIIIPRDPNLGQQIYEIYLADKWQPEDTRIKLKPIKNDQKALEHLFSDTDEHIADSNLTINYNYFYDRIQKAEIGIDDLASAIDRLEVINIVLDEHDNPQLIFESLNSTGLDLSEGDKIRNYILMGLPPAQQERFYEKYWNKIEVCTEYDVSAFVRDYLSVKQQATPAIKNVYFVFKDYVEKPDAPSTEDLLIDLLSYAKKYEYLIKANSPWAKANQYIYRLNRLKTTVTRPFFMEVLRLKEEGRLSETELGEAFGIIENYLFRRSICDVPTNALNKIFLLLHKDIMRLDGTDENYIEKLKCVLLNKQESGRFPDDEEFSEALLTKNIYGMRGESKGYLFERLENAGTLETKDVWAHMDNGDYSVEHILPQHLTPSWTDALGDDYERVHHDWLHRLANLTLTAYNPKYSNRPFDEKRDMENGFKQSGLRLNQWIWQQDKWGETELEERNAMLLTQALKIWPPIESNYEPPQKQFDTVTLEDDVNFTNKTISRFAFMGNEQTVESWTDMYQQVLTQLHDIDKSILTKLAVCDDPTVDLSRHFWTSAKDSLSGKMIGHNVFLWTGINTQNKIVALRKVFNLFDIDPSELVFYLGGEGKKDYDDTGRHLIRRRYWTYALPIMREVSGTFGNCSPSKNNWLDGFMGLGNLIISCIANYDSARVELYMKLPEKAQNKQLFDFLCAHKDEIESAANRIFVWERSDDTKASRICLPLPDVSVTNEADWPRMAQFHAEGSKIILDVFKPYLVEYLSRS